VGQHPVRAVQTLDAIIRDAETMPLAAVVPVAGPHLLGGHGRALCEAAITLAVRGGAAAIAALTRAGKTARLLSALRPAVPVLAATDSAETARRLALAWGIAPVHTDLDGDVGELAGRIGRMLLARGLVEPSATIVLVSITPDTAPGPANFVKLERV
jgi:pyruvate kinase